MSKTKCVSVLSREKNTLNNTLMRQGTLVFLIFLGLHTAGIAQPTGTSGVYSVLDFGALRNQRVTAQPFIQRAIDSCAAQDGGTVLFPAGDYYSATIRLRSNVELSLSSGAVLHALPDPTRYANDEAGWLCCMAPWRRILT